MTPNDLHVLRQSLCLQEQEYMAAMQRLQQYQQETNQLVRAAQGPSGLYPGNITPEQRQMLAARQVSQSDSTLHDMLTRK